MTTDNVLRDLYNKLRVSYEVASAGSIRLRSRDVQVAEDLCLFRDKAGNAFSSLDKTTVDLIVNVAAYLRKQGYKVDMTKSPYVW